MQYNTHHQLCSTSKFYSPLTYPPSSFSLTYPRSKSNPILHVCNIPCPSNIPSPSYAHLKSYFPIYIDCSRHIPFSTQVLLKPYSTLHPTTCSRHKLPPPTHASELSFPPILTPPPPMLKTWLPPTYPCSRLILPQPILCLRIQMLKT